MTNLRRFKDLGKICQMDAINSINEVKQDPRKANQAITRLTKKFVTLEELADFVGDMEFYADFDKFDKLTELVTEVTSQLTKAIREIRRIRMRYIKANKINRYERDGIADLLDPEILAKVAEWTKPKSKGGK